MKAGIFSDAVESSAKVFGRKDDVRVVFEGSDAKTDGNTIFLPSLPEGAEITVDQADVIRGFRDHESMHVRCTDTSPSMMTTLHNITTASAHHGQVLQYCEDVRIENAGISEYPGMKMTLSATNKHAAKMLITQLEARGNPVDVVKTLPPALKFRFMLQSLARESIGVESGGVFPLLCDSIKASDPELHALATKYAHRMAALPTGIKSGKLNEAASKRGTSDAVALSQEIMDAYKAYEASPPPPPPPPPQPAPQPQPSKEKGDGEGEGSNGDGEKGDEDDGTQGSGDSKSDESGGGDGDEDQTPAQPGDDEGDDEADQSDGDGDDSEDQGDGGDDGDDSDDEGDGNDQGDQGDGDSNDDQSGGNGSDAGDDAGDDGQSGTADGGGGGHADGEAGEAQQASSSDSPSDGSGNHTPVLSPEDLQAFDNLYQDALKDVIQDLTDGKDAYQGSGAKKQLFQVFSHRFSQVLPMCEVSYAGNGVKASDTSTKMYLINAALATMADIDKSLGGKKAMIRRLLELELQARSDRKWEGGHKSGRLQSVRLVQALQGRETVYQKRENGKDMDTLLYISIDGSGSMQGPLAREAVALAYALSEALERTGCSIHVGMWGNQIVWKEQCSLAKYTKNDFLQFRTDTNADSVGRFHGNDNGDRFSSSGVLTRGLIKSTRQRTSDPTVRAAFGMAANAMESSTPSYQAIFDDLRDVGREVNAKKIYLHITDGEPDRLSGLMTKQEIMKEAHDYAFSLGIHMIGVGVNGMQVKHMFQDSIEVQGADAYEPVIRKLAKLVAKESGHAAHFKRAA